MNEKTVVFSVLRELITFVKHALGLKANTADLAPVATSGNYNDLTGKPTIPAAVTEATVTGWGFTKNTGTYNKPSGGIPASDLASGVIPSVPQMATQANMSDWTSGKTVDAAVLKANFQNALVQLGEVQDDVARKANVSELPTAVSELTNDSDYQTAQQVQTAIAAAAELPSGGSTGDFLRKTASGVAWQTVPAAESNSFGGGA